MNIFETIWHPACVLKIDWCLVRYETYSLWGMCITEVWYQLNFDVFFPPLYFCLCSLQTTRVKEINLNMWDEQVGAAGFGRSFGLVVGLQWTVWTHGLALRGYTHQHVHAQIYPSPTSHIHSRQTTYRRMTEISSQATKLQHAVQ